MYRWMIIVLFVNYASSNQVCIDCRNTYEERLKLNPHAKSALDHCAAFTEFNRCLQSNNCNAEYSSRRNPKPKGWVCHTRVKIANPYEYSYVHYNEGGADNCFNGCDQDADHPIQAASKSLATEECLACKTRFYSCPEFKEVYRCLKDNKCDAEFSTKQSRQPKDWECHKRLLLPNEQTYILYLVGGTSRCLVGCDVGEKEDSGAGPLRQTALYVLIAFCLASLRAMIQ